MPCWELFEAQPQPYRDAVLPPDVRARVSIEAASPFGWERYVGRDGASVGVDRFGASAPGPVVMREFGFTPEHVMATSQDRAGAAASRSTHQVTTPPAAAQAGGGIVVWVRGRAQDMLERVRLAASRYEHEDASRRRDGRERQRQTGEGLHRGGHGDHPTRRLVQRRRTREERGGVAVCSEAQQHEIESTWTCDHGT